MASQMSFLFDQKWCIGCQSCVTACQMRHRCPDDVYLRDATSFEDYPVGPWLSTACNHCENPACVTVCPTTALTKRDDGIVVQDHNLCIGCKSCMMACPYDHPKYLPEEGYTLKCDMCAYRLDHDDVPACVEACPMKCLTVGTLEENEKAGGVAQGVGNTVESTGPTTRYIPIA